MHHYPFSNIGDASLTFLKIYGDASLTFLKDLCDASLAPIVTVLVKHYFSQVFFSSDGRGYPRGGIELTLTLPLIYPDPCQG